jgi:hypothetical protein
MNASRTALVMLCSGSSLLYKSISKTRVPKKQRLKILVLGPCQKFIRREKIHPEVPKKMVVKNLEVLRNSLLTSLY